MPAKHQTEIKTEKTGTGSHIFLIGADHLHGEDETKTKERLAGSAVSPGVLDKILTQEGEDQMHAFISHLWFHLLSLRREQFEWEIR